MADNRTSRTPARAFGLPASLGALGHSGYRRFWFASLASVGGYQLQVLGQGWLVFKLTGSALNLGLLGAAMATPAILMSLFGGVLADRVDKRSLIVATSLATGSLLLLLAMLDARGIVQVWHVYAVAAAIGLISGIEWPTRQAVFPLLIEREQMTSAVALNSVLLIHNLCSVLAMIAFCRSSVKVTKKALYPATFTTRSRYFSGSFWAALSVSEETTLICT